MKTTLFLVVTGISNSTNTPFEHRLEKHYESLETCVQASITLRKVLQAKDNLQIRDTDVFAHCEVGQEGLSTGERNAANNKIRRLEKIYSTAKW